MSRQEHTYTRQDRSYPQYDPDLGEWVAESLAGDEVYGQTEEQCWLNLLDHNDACIDDWFKRSSDTDRQRMKTALAESLDDARGLPLPFED